MAETIDIILGEDSVGKRLDAALVKHLGNDFSRARIQDIIKEGGVMQARLPLTQPSFKLKLPTKVTVSVPDPAPAEPEAEDIPLDIVFEDEDLLVINKQAGLVVHPGAGNWGGTLVNALLHHCKDDLSGIGGVERPGIVHRLDKDTSGLMLVAKNDKAHRALTEQLSDRSLSRTYAALVWGMPVPLEGRIEGNIGRHPSNRLKQAMVKDGGREAITDYKVIARYKENVISLVECTLQTGRTHQIRVHMAFKGHEIVGDPLYGRQITAGRARMKEAGYDQDIREQVLAFPRQALHAQKIGFVHPRIGEYMQFKGDLPEDIAAIAKILSQ